MKKIKLAALIAAIIAGVGVYFFLKELKAPQEVPHTNVVAAIVDIPENTKITADMVALQPIVSEDVRDHMLTDLNSVIGLVSAGDIFAGEQILSDRLIRTGETGEKSSSLAYILEDGMRAVTIAVSSVTGIENMLRPGNRVDMLCVYSYEKESAAGEPEEITAVRLLLQNKKILAVGSELSKNGSAQYGSVTLETTPEEAALITYAELTGSIRLLLRSSLDNEIVDIGEVDMESLRKDVPSQ